MAKRAPAPPKNRSEELKPLLTLLQDVRREANLTQVELAKRLYEPQSYVSKYESGERRLDLFELQAICRAVGATLPDFVRRFEALYAAPPAGSSEAAPSSMNEQDRSEG